MTKTRFYFPFDRKNCGFRCILAVCPLRQGETFAAVFLEVINLAKNFSPIDSLSTGRSITWTQLGLAFSQIVMLLGGFIGLSGIVIFTRRELARIARNGFEVAQLSAADAAVFNYRTIFTSGAAALARSWGVPILIPSRLATVALDEPAPTVFRFDRLTRSEPGRRVEATSVG